MEWVARKMANSSRELVRALAERTSVGIVLLDETLSVVEPANAAAEKFLVAAQSTFHLTGKELCQRLARAALSRVDHCSAPVQWCSVCPLPNGGQCRVGVILFLAQTKEGAYKVFFYQYIYPLTPGADRDEPVCASRGRPPLSGRESEVLKLMMEGISNREIASCLSISIHTVKRHSENIYDKLQIHGKKMIANRLLAEKTREVFGT